MAWKEQFISAAHEAVDAERGSDASAIIGAVRKLDTLKRTLEVLEIDENITIGAALPVVFPYCPPPQVEHLFHKCASIYLYKRRSYDTTRES